MEQKLEINNEQTIKIVENKVEPLSDLNPNTDLATARSGDYRYGGSNTGTGGLAASASELFPQTEQNDNVKDCESHEARARSPEIPDGIEDIDAGDQEDPELMAVYIKEIYMYLKDLEARFPIEENFMSKQIHLTVLMREELVAWLVELQEYYSLSLATFHLTVGIIDRYLQAVPDFDPKKLELIGVTALYIGSKYEEERQSRLYIVEFAKLIDFSCSKEDIIRCERMILSKLDFCLARPTPACFLKRFLKAAHGSTMVCQLAEYLVDLSLLKDTMAHYRPSELAAAAICLSLSFLSNKAVEQAWSPTMTYYSGYKIEEILHIVKKIASIVIKARNLKYKTVYNKYSKARLGRVARLNNLSKRGLSQIVKIDDIVGT